MVGTAEGRKKGRRNRTAIEAWLPARRLFTVAEYERMIAAGILAEGERVELVEGEIVQMAALGSRHAGCVDWLSHEFHMRVGGRVVVRVQSPVRLPPRAEPEPDVMLLRHRPDFYRSAHPGPDDVLLLIEVADTSLPYDRTVKQSLYATAGIREFWIVDLAGETVIVCRAPRDGRYTEVSEVARGGTVSPTTFPELRLAVDDILG